MAPNQNYWISLSFMTHNDINYYTDTTERIKYKHYDNSKIIKFVRWIFIKLKFNKMKDYGI